MPRRIRGFVVLLMCFIVAACDSKAVFDSYKSFPNKWHKDSVASFEFKAPDTVNNYNLFINIRNNNNYKYNNLFLIAQLNYPNGKIVKDTLEYKMAKPSGELLGVGFTDVKENKLWFKGYNTSFRFEENGKYQVILQHAMRQNGMVNGITDLEGITEVGFRLEPVE
jgi:gliding motility-associated lipoprotein GldH